jgi:hypothetical protein
MAAAAAGRELHDRVRGTAQYDFAPDVGRAFALAARATADGAHVANFPGLSSSMEQVVAAIESAAPEVAGKIHPGETRLPFPEALQASVLERLVGPLPHTSLAHGAARTIEHVRARASSGETGAARPAR